MYVALWDYGTKRVFRNGIPLANLNSTVVLSGDMVKPVRGESQKVRQYPYTVEVNMNIKCIGCFDLLRKEVTLDGQPFVVYKCPRFFPYATVISGLLRPGSGIVKAVKDCPEDPLSHCAVCSNTKITHYGQDIISICSEHDKAWGKWLDQHPERRAHLAPRGRSIKANWVEVFREFVEDIRRQK